VDEWFVHLPAGKGEHLSYLRMAGSLCARSDWNAEKNTIRRNAHRHSKGRKRKFNKDGRHRLRVHSVRRRRHLFFTPPPLLSCSRSSVKVYGQYSCCCSSPRCSQPSAVAQSAVTPSSPRRRTFPSRQRSVAESHPYDSGQQARGRAERRSAVAVRRAVLAQLPAVVVDDVVGVRFPADTRRSRQRRGPGRLPGGRCPRRSPAAVHD
jgi:hypothetical protein